MTVTVSAPNGATVDFPDGTDHATIDAAMRQHFGGDKPPATSGAAKGTADNPLDDVAHAASAGTIARASLPPDPQVQIKRYAEAFNQPPSDFGVVGDHIVRKLPGTNDQFARVEPSVFHGATGPLDMAERAMRWVAGGAGPAIPAVASGAAATAAAILATPETAGAGALPAAMAAGAGGASAGEIARQKLDAALAPKGEEAPMDYKNVAWQGAAGATGPLLGKAVSAVGGRLAPALEEAAADELPWGSSAEQAARAGLAPAAASTSSFGLSPRVTEALKQHIAGKEAELAQLRKDAQDLGVDLSLGQMTGSEAVKQSERQLIRQPETVQAVTDLRNTQNTEQIPAAVRSVLDEVAPDAAPGQQVAAFRDAADAVVSKAADTQSKIATAAYAKALDDPSKPLHYSDDLQKLVKDIADWNPGALKDALASAKARGYDVKPFVDFDADGNAVLNGSEPSWRAMDFLKRALSGVENGNLNAQGRLNNTGDIAKTFRQKLTGLLDTQNPDYAAARAQFGNSADAIDQILNGGVGFLNKMSGPDRQNMVNRVFSGQNLMADDIATMRRQFAYAGKSGDWNSGLRSYIADKLADAVSPLKQGGEPSNVAGSLYKSLFEDRQAGILKAAMGGDANDALVGRWNQLGRVLKAASNQLPEGSPTATDTAAPGLVQRGVQALKYITHPASMGADLMDGLSKMKDPEEAKKLATYLLTPEGDKLLKTLQPTTPGTPKANSILGTMLTQAGIVAAEDRAAR